MRCGVAATAVVALLGITQATTATAAGDGAYTEFIGAALPCGTRHIVIEAPDRAWGIRDVARQMDAQLPSVRMHYRRGLTADDWPKAVHIQVSIGHYGDPLVVGYAAADRTYAEPPAPEPPPMYLQAGYWRQDGRRHLWLNEDIESSPFYSQPDVDFDMASVRKWYAAHEFGHTLGLAHHSLPGIMGGRSTDQHDLGPEEVLAIEDTLGACRAVARR